MKTIIRLSHCIWLVLLIVCPTIFCFGQTYSLTNKLTFYDMVKSCYDSTSNDSVNQENGEIEEFVEEMNRIWAPRLAPSGDCRKAANAIVNYAQTYVPALTNYQPNWKCLGPHHNPINLVRPPKVAFPNVASSGIGQIHRITFDPHYGQSNNIVYCTSNFGGLWRSENSGASWQLANTDFLPMTNVADVAINAQNNHMIFIATGFCDVGFPTGWGPNWGIINPLTTIGIYRSKDNTASWEPINNGFLDDFFDGGTARRIISDPSDPNYLFVATSNGIYRSTNATSDNVTWERVFTGVQGSQDPEFRGLEFNPENSNTIYASGQNVYISRDRGSSWFVLTGPGTSLNWNNLPDNFVPNRISIAVTPADTSRLYACVEGSVIKNSKKYEAVYIFFDSSNVWKNKFYNAEYTVVDNGRFSSAWNTISASPMYPDEVVFGCRDIFLARPNSWLTFSRVSYNQLTDGMHPDIHGITYEPHITNIPNINRPRFFCGTDGGVTIVDYWGQIPFRFLNNGLENSTIWSFDDTESNQNEIFISNQDNGNIGSYYNNLTDSIDWYKFTGGDGYGVGINKMNSNSIYCNVNSDPVFFKYCDYEAKDFYDATVFPLDNCDGNPAAIPATLPIVNHPRTGSLYFGLSELYRREIDGTGSAMPWQNLWTQESDLCVTQPASSARQITEAVFAESNPNYIYLVTGGQTRPEIGSVLPSLLFRSTTGGLTDNVNSNHPVFHSVDFPGSGTPSLEIPIITGIAVDPMDENRFWISFTGYKQHYKVYYYNGDSINNPWVDADPDSTLSNLPVNGIVYQAGTNDRLYIATDAGVYVRNGPQGTAWEKYGNFPNVRAVELKINYCANKLRVATFGRGIWEGDLLPSTQSFEKVVSENESWDFRRNLHGDLRIKSGATLTVSSIVNMPPNSKVIVEPGGVLTIDGGTFTNACGSLWKGIELWGNHSLAQMPVTNQGHIQIINEGKIENAEIAILVGKRLADNSGFDPSFAGGLAWSIDGNFINNKVAVLFTPYSFYNNCHFRNTDFLTNAALNESAQPDCFIKAYGVTNVNIYGCTFRNTRGWYEVAESDRGTGIYCDNARVFMDEGCQVNEVPCNQVIPGLFEKLYRGVYLMNSGSLAFADIRNTNFYDNARGVYISGSSGASHSSIIQCNFRVLRPYEDIDTYAMYLNECSGYKIEENSFYSEGSYCDGIGLIVNNSIVDEPAEINQIYRNTFTNLQYATIAQNRNRNATTGEGLCYKCNKFFDNYSDISVTKDPEIPVTHSFGIAVNQGRNSPTPTGPAGNMFDYTPLSSHWDLDNGLASFNYYYHNGTFPPYTRLRPDYRQGLITPTGLPVAYMEATACPPSSSGNGTSEEEMDGMASSAEKSDSIQEILAIHVDGGSTETLKNEVETSIPPEALPIRDELMASTPYLSDTVMQTAIEKEDVLNNTMIRDIMVANPHSSKSEILIDLLENRTVPMPDYLMAEILQGEDSISGKENLESEKAFWNAERSKHYHNLIRYYRNDSVAGLANDSLIYLLQLHNTIDSWYDLIAVCFHKGEYQTGLNLLNSIPGSFSLNENQQEIHQSFVDLFAILKKVETDSSSVLNIDSTDIQTLVSVYTSNQGQVSAFARNLLLAAEKTVYTEPIFLPESGLKSSKRGKYRGDKTHFEANLLKVYPNPAKTHFVVEYHLNEIAEGCCIEITNILGKKLKRIPLTQKNDQKLIPVDGMGQGVYLVTLKNHGKSVQEAKITLIR
ncbi:MAG: T9SS type A sorting domain-containing protein [Bacteroidales bacterium]